MKIAEHRTTETRSEVFTVDDGEIRPVPYSRDGRQYRVDRVEITWRTDGGEWTVGSPLARGQVLKKDGADSKNRTEERFWVKTLPGWLSELVTATNPTPANPQRDTARETDQPEETA